VTARGRRMAGKRASWRMNRGLRTNISISSRAHRRKALGGIHI
jgi:hypothetical protein